MLPSADTTFDYATLPTEKAASARAAAERIRGRMQLAAESIIEVGRELIEQKHLLGHGNFLPWIAAEFGMSADTAGRFMNVAERLAGEFRTVRNLPPTALYALASPSTPEPIREAVLERAASGEKVTAKEIEALKKKALKAEAALEEERGKVVFAQAEANMAVEREKKAKSELMYAASDKDRLEVQLNELQDEIERLKEDGTIHVMPSEPSATEVVRVVEADYTAAIEAAQRLIRAFPSSAQRQFFNGFGLTFTT